MKLNDPKASPDQFQSSVSRDVSWEAISILKKLLQGEQKSALLSQRELEVIGSGSIMPA